MTCIYRYAKNTPCTAFCTGLSPRLVVIIAPVAAADDDQLSPLATFDNVQFAADFDKVFHLGAYLAVGKFAAQVFVNQFAQSVLRDAARGIALSELHESLLKQQAILAYSDASKVSVA